MNRESGIDLTAVGIREKAETIVGIVTITMRENAETLQPANCPRMFSE